MCLNFVHFYFRIATSNFRFYAPLPSLIETFLRRVRVYGPGIEPTGPVVGAPANFTVEAFSAGRGQVDVVVENPNGQKEPVEVRFNNDRNLTHSVSYTPKLEGNHKITVKFAGREVPKSPFVVQVRIFASMKKKTVF